MHCTCNHLLQDSHWIMRSPFASVALQTQRVPSFDLVLCSVEGVNMSGSVPLVGDRLVLPLEAKASYELGCSCIALNLVTSMDA
jgi:hypothetical protein